MTKDQMTPLEKTEALYAELVAGYGGGSDRETRAAAKLLMVALAKLKEHAGPGWQSLAEEYIHMLRDDPARFERLLEANRGHGKQQRVDPDGVDTLIA